VRRHWRFGQERPVNVDLVLTGGQVRIQENLERKSDQADEMFSQLVAHMSDAMVINRLYEYKQKMEVPSWL
jgi:hypothetical protein